MMRGPGLLALAAASVVVAGCVSRDGYSSSVSTRVIGKAFEVDRQGVGFLMRTAPELLPGNRVEAQCPGGRVSNVVSEATVRNWFGVVQVYDVALRGVCNEPEAR